jgi:hypothetical protein
VDFHEGHGTVKAWNVRSTAMCELARPDMAGAQQGRGMGTAWYV